MCKGKQGAGVRRSPPERARAREARRVPGRRVPLDRRRQSAASIQQWGAVCRAAEAEAGPAWRPAELDGIERRQAVGRTRWAERGAHLHTIQPHPELKSLAARTLVH